MWILLPIEYFIINKKSSILTNFGISLIITLSAVYIHGICISKYTSKFLDNSISSLSLLVGFTIAVFTLLITSNNNNIEEIKRTYVKNITLYNKQVSIYDSFLIKMSYLIFMESLLLLFSIVYPFFFSFDNPNITNAFSTYTCIFLLIHIIISNISNILDLYFILTKKD